jgi:hypothetical protein
MKTNREWQQWFIEKALTGGFHYQRDDDQPGGSAANSLAKVVIRKRNDDTPLLFDDILLRDQPLADDNIERTNTEDDDKKLSAKLKEIVAAMVAAAPSLHPQHAMRWLMHSEQGRALLSQHTTKGDTMPQVDIAKIIPVLEDALMAQAKLDRRVKKNGNTETDAEAFSRRYTDDIDFRKQWRDISETKQLLALAQTKSYPNLMNVVPVSTEIGDTNTDGTAEATKAAAQLAALVEDQRRLAPTLNTSQLYERVYADPTNKAIVHRAHRRPTASSTSGDELQR